MHVDVYSKWIQTVKWSLIGKEKNACVKSMAVYCVPGAILIYTSKVSASGSAAAIGDTMYMCLQKSPAIAIL